jgi:hypothetical protein
LDRGDCRQNRRFIVRYSAGDRCNSTGASALDPRHEARLSLASDREVEFGDVLARLDQGWHASFYRSDGHRLCLR